MTGEELTLQEVKGYGSKVHQYTGHDVITYL